MCLVYQVEKKNVRTTQFCAIRHKSPWMKFAWIQAKARARARTFTLSFSLQSVCLTVCGKIIYQTNWFSPKPKPSNYEQLLCCTWIWRSKKKKPIVSALYFRFILNHIYNNSTIVQLLYIIDFCIFWTKTHGTLVICCKHTQQHTQHTYLCTHSTRLCLTHRH